MMLTISANPSRWCVLQGRMSLRVPDSGVCARRQELPDHILLSRSAVVEEDGFLHGGPAEVVDVVYRHPGCDQDPHRLGVAVFAG